MTWLMAWLPHLTMTLLAMVGGLMIFIILLQRGRGGGLAGALGGMGGTSAFGTRAGDVFTKITIGLAIVWTLLAAINVWVLGMNTTRFKGGTVAVPTAAALDSAAVAGATSGGESTPDDALSTQPAATTDSGTGQGSTSSPAGAATPVDSNAKPASESPVDASDKPESKAEPD
jgi:preprotein translocase subunit SecG